jgi:predicted transcriptional regulator
MDIETGLNSTNEALLNVFKRLKEIEEKLKELSEEQEWVESWIDRLKNAVTDEYNYWDD